MKWNYVDKDGNPKKAGRYWVTLIYPEMRNVGEAGKMLAEVGSRDFMDITNVDRGTDWRMCDQPETGLVWTEEIGSSEKETVWAWAEMEETPFPERLPEGVEKYRGGSYEI